jgi:predicted PurR-regulated permease PerM
MDSSRAARWVTLLLALAVALYLCWRMMQPFVSVLLWAVVLAVVFMPVHRRLEKRLGRPSLGAALSTAIVVVVIVAPVSLITFAVVQELRGLARTLGAHQGPWIDPTHPVVGRILAWIEPYVDVQQLQSPEFLKAHLDDWSGALANSTIGFVGGIAATLISTVLVVFTLYYLFRDAEAIRDAVYDIIPIERAKTHRIFTRTKEVVAASVYGVIVIAAIQGALGFFIFWALGLPSPLLWGVVMFVLSMIPMAGAVLVWAPAALYLAFTGAMLKAAILTGWGVLVVGSIDNVLSPRLVGKRTRMHELLIFFAVLGGIQVFGVIGVVLGPVIVAVTLALIEIIRQADEPVADPAQEETVFDKQEEIRRVS